MPGCHQHLSRHPVQQQQHGVHRHVDNKGQGGDANGGTYGIECVAARHHAVERPDHRSQNKQNVAAPDATAVECVQQAGTANQQITANDQRQAQRPRRGDAVAQQQHGHQRRPQRQAARHQHRGVGRRSKDEAAIGQHGIQQPAKNANRQGLAQW